MRVLLQIKVQKQSSQNQSVEIKVIWQGLDSPVPYSMLPFDIITCTFSDVASDKEQQAGCSNLKWDSSNKSTTFF